MKRQILVAALAASIPFAGAGAQVNSLSRGFTAGIGLTGTSISTNVTGRSESESGGGVNIEVGYGFGSKLSIFLGAYGSQIDAVPDFSLNQLDIGLRYMFRDTDKKARPYIEGGIATRQFRVDGETEEDVAVTLKATSGGLALGGGVQYFFTPRVAFDLGLNYATGSFSEWKVNGLTVPFRDVDATSANVRIGLRFWPLGQ